ncbi:hypothetical protein F4808DRAFT_441382 [Astrocystis sublimbata]|nr:hypothetical protein F4808DRAFT_441382 [Astrocystis sublimbata]
MPLVRSTMPFCTSHPSCVSLKLILLLHPLPTCTHNLLLSQRNRMAIALHPDPIGRVAMAIDKPDLLSTATAETPWLTLQALCMNRLSMSTGHPGTGG